MSQDVDDSEFEGTGIVVPDLVDNPDSMDKLAHCILDDVLFNIIHDILLKTHHEVKTAKANTAAIMIEQEAAQQLEESTSHSQSSSADSAKTPPLPRLHQYPHKLETDSAIWEDGVVYIKGNPLANVKEIRCPKCGLPKLLHPTDGNGARQPEAGKAYCQRHPFISKPGHDIYGIPFPKDDLGSGGKKQPKDKSSSSSSSFSTSSFSKSNNSSSSSNSTTLLKQASSNLNNGFLGWGGSQNDSTPADSSFSSPGPSPPSSTNESQHQLPQQQHPKPRSLFPNVECPNCGRSVNVRVFARHLNNHLKGGGRASSRAAMAKMNGGDKASQAGSTPPGSRRGTPSVSGGGGGGGGGAVAKSSPHKRTADEMLDDDEDDDHEDEGSRRTSSEGEEEYDDDARGRRRQPPKKKRRRRKTPAPAPAPPSASASASTSTTASVTNAAVAATTTTTTKPKLKLKVKEPVSGSASHHANGNSNGLNPGNGIDATGAVKKSKLAASEPTGRVAPQKETKILPPSKKSGGSAPQHGDQLNSSQTMDLTAD